MSKLTEKAAYLKGLAEGLNISPSTNESKLLLALLELTADMAAAMNVMEQRIADAEESIDDVSDDLADLEEYVFEDDDDYEYDDDDDYDDMIELNGDDYVQYDCPHCGDSIHYDPEGFDMDLPHPCPNCGKELFPKE